ncbi:hypothetical protein DSO57_1035637 [Entomophthora muscae]|nr:hypothetical protein DSO57_1035637 [Entomophthora muscae]
MSSNLNIMDDLSSKFGSVRVSSASDCNREGPQSSHNDCNSTSRDNESCLDSEDISFTGTLVGLMNDQDLTEILNVQNEVTESLSALALKCQSFQEFSQVKFHDLSKRFETHTATTKELQHDLGSIFRRIR